MAFAMAATLVMLVAVQEPLQAQQQRPWKVAQVGGDAWLQNAGAAARPVHEGDKLGPGGLVIAGDGGSVTLIRAGALMTLSANSRTEIPSDSGPGGATVLQRAGDLHIEVDAPPDQHFQVDTPHLTALVKGTTFDVHVESGGASVHVVEGILEVRALASGDVAMVQSGQTARVSQQTGGRLDVEDPE